MPLPAALAARVARALPARPSLALSLRRRFGRSAPADLGELWPRLSLISCWTDGHASRALEAMRRRFPHVEVQGKGLLATEGVVSFPLVPADGAVAAVTSHFLEFIPHDEPTSPVTVEQLEQDRVYEVVLTTSGGLYRYRLRDLVQVDGRFRQTPILRFVGRADRASDLAGEKLTPAFAEAVMRTASERAGVQASFAMLAPAWGTPPCYALIIAAARGDAERVAAAIEEELGASHHYALCRSLGQLGPVKPIAALDAERRYEDACLARGQRAGAIKPPVLATELGWVEHFREPVAAPHIPVVLSPRHRQPA